MHGRPRNLCRRTWRAPGAPPLPPLPPAPPTLLHSRLCRLEFGAANVTVSAPARAAVNASWAALIPDTYVVNEMHQNAVYALPPGAIHLGWSQRVPVEMFVAGPYLNALAFQASPGLGAAAVFSLQLH